MLIGEVSEQSGISARMLRHYDSIGLVSPTGRTPGGYRQYSDDDVRRLFHVEGLRSLGLSLQEITGVLNGVSFSPASMVEQLIARTHERLAQEEELLNLLRQVSASEPTAWSDVLRTISLVRGLDANNPSARQRFALSLTEENDQDAALLAEAALDEADPNVAGALHWVLERAGDDAVPTLASALDSDDPARRRRAVDALVKIDSARSRATLADAHHHPDPVVSTRAALIRGVQGTHDAIPALVSLVINGRDDVEATDVLGTLASQHGHADEITRAIADAFERPDGAARLRLTAALAAIPGELAKEMLEAACADPDRRVALTASFVLSTRQPDS